MTDAVELRGITKRFPRVVANEKVDFTARTGEVHALVGENGAGKSTLMKVLAGMYPPDEGTITVKGEPLPGGDPREAIRRGLGMVHQHFMLVPPFTVAENLVLGAEGGLLLDRAKARKAVLELGERHGLEVNPDARVEDLSVGEQQRVEILKVLHRGAKVLILDEPTAVLTPPEVEDLLRVLRSLREQGCTVIFITHKLKEVMAISDRVTVMRRGAVVGTVATKETSPAALAELMVGRPVLIEVERKPATKGDVVLSVEKLSARSRRGLVALGNVSFEVRAGEIFGIAGVEGNGQTELVSALAGIDLPFAGSVKLSGRDVTRASPRERLEGGFAHVAEDRHRHAVVLDMSVVENAILGSQRAYDRILWMDERGARTFAAELIAALDVRPPEPFVPLRGLSGGNQQKLVVARELARKPRCLIVSQLTRGVDIGATQAIWKKVIDARDAGAAVLLVSADLAEVLSLADRVGVLYAGKLVVLEPGASEAEIGRLMAGIA